ncbi:DUF6776 family protein [Halopseudomonas salegens]|uniref:Uncharacterized protein n=1 Tax=Halopseudomonas salegens TaxID=1434072 RepID=A0A1H2DZI5_9GAMM|nr:DUF6776 family protein [Halopseudomonas salegens]SDT88303.1 hypothetical protein SAMN05216210_0149 [Halopseudomonas salegens]
MGRRSYASLRDHSVVLMPRNTPFVKGLKRLLLLALVLAVPAAAWLGWQAGQKSQIEVTVQRDILLANEQRLQTELLEQRQRLQQMDVDVMLANQSYAESQQLVRTMEQQLFRLQQDLAQYQGALDSDAATPGLRIQYFDLQPADVPNTYRFRVMVSRVGTESENVTATLDMQVHGEQSGETVSLSLSDMNAASSDSLPLDFRYFQVVPEEPELALLTLPVDFIPKTVELRAKNNGETLVEHRFDWTTTGVRP